MRRATPSTRSPTLAPRPSPSPFSADELRSTRERWLSEFNRAFALTSVIPLLICCYLITVKFFSITILAGMNGVYFLLAVILALLGLAAGRQVLRSVIDQLIEANDRLKRFQTMQSEFVHHVAHELRSPLASIKGALDNLKDGLHGHLTPDQLEPIAMSHREMTRLRRVIADLLDVGQIEAGRLSLRQEEVVLQDVLRQVARSCRGLSDARGLRLDLELPEAPITITGDRDRLSQVFINLVTNAVKFTEQGRILVRLSHDGEAVQVEVADTGRGIAAEDLERVFQRFERVGDATPEGSGLGLHIAKSIVELHHGRIWVESQLGQGSRFLMRLPATPSAGSLERH